MDFNTLINTEGNETVIVENKNTAISVGSGSANVFATPAMIALMEKTAFNSIDKKLLPELSSVGIEINTKHNRATLPGAVIICKSIVEKVENKKIHFNIEAFDEKGSIGTAKHIRYIVNSKDFMNKLLKSTDEQQLIKKLNANSL